jgi:hypothetical protein
MPPRTTVWPSLTSTCVVISRVSMLGTKPPVALGTTGADAVLADGQVEDDAIVRA